MAFTTRRTSLCPAVAQMVALETRRDDLRTALTRTSLRVDQYRAVDRLDIKAARRVVTDPTCERADAPPKRPNIVAPHAPSKGYRIGHGSLPVGYLVILSWQTLRLWSSRGSSTPGGQVRLADFSTTCAGRRGCIATNKLRLWAWLKRRRRALVCPCRPLSQARRVLGKCAGGEEVNDLSDRPRRARQRTVAAPRAPRLPTHAALQSAARPSGRTAPHRGHHPVVFGPASGIAAPPRLKSNQFTRHRTCSPACCEADATMPPSFGWPPELPDTPARKGRRFASDRGVTAISVCAPQLTDLTVEGVSSTAEDASKSKPHLFMASS